MDCRKKRPSKCFHNNGAAPWAIYLNGPVIPRPDVVNVAVLARYGSTAMLIRNAPGGRF